MSWDENTLLQAIARLTERAENAERRLRHAEFHSGRRQRKRVNRRRELRNLHKALQRYITTCRWLAARNSAMEDDKRAMAKCAADAIEHLRGRVAELEAR